MDRMSYERTLTEHIMQLREKVAHIQSDVAHLAHGQDVHSGSQVRTEQQLAHIAASLAEAHGMIRRVQSDVAAMMSKRPVQVTLAEWWPAIVGVSALVAVLAGKGDLASRLTALR